MEKKGVDACADGAIGQEMDNSGYGRVEGKWWSRKIHSASSRAGGNIEDVHRNKVPIEDMGEAVIYYHGL